MYRCHFNYHRKMSQKYERYRKMFQTEIVWSEGK